MDALTVIILLVLIAAVAAAVVVAVIMMRRRRSEQLQQSFGSEYQRTVEGADDRGSAEKDLRQREKRRDRFEVQPLSSDAAARYRDEWNGIQQRFVDEPGRAVEQADRLVVRVMQERGYPVDDFEQRADDVSVDHPEIVHHYREAHGIATAQARGQADTEQLRQAVTSYRALVDALLDEHSTDGSQQPRQSPDLQEER